MLVALRISAGGGIKCWIHSLSIIAWLSKNTLLIVIHSVISEKFYITIEEAETACIQLMKTNNSARSQKRLCMSVIQANRSFSKMTACGLFYVDAKLPIYLMRNFTTYIFVLLQLNFLQNT
ncbi:hypothetical protein PYW08_009406 [Mythimna loreyi]|uniref:Uncharacterized protein n=1 Tax=Mythimna loreyi TaxID=667449 RepID=A0ACC2Q9E3_9NEOP|nr:hypothetical protein PYW08_009406 [Mythimna loreyi]